MAKACVGQWQEFLPLFGNIFHEALRGLANKGFCGIIAIQKDA
jgi:hypothetical protein